MRDAIPILVQCAIKIEPVHVGDDMDVPPRAQSPSDVIVATGTMMTRQAQDSTTDESGDR